jgi:pentapeptide repeat protein
MGLRHDSRDRGGMLEQPFALRAWSLMRRRDIRQQEYIRVFSASEKNRLLCRRFRDVNLDNVDLSQADLRDATIERASLLGADLRGTDLRGARILGCDLRHASLEGVRLGTNRFDGTWFIGATGLNAAHRAYIAGRGGLFLQVVTGDRIR